MTDELLQYLRNAKVLFLNGKYIIYIVISKFVNVSVLDLSYIFFQDQPVYAKARAE